MKRLCRQSVPFYGCHTSESWYPVHRGSDAKRIMPCPWHFGWMPAFAGMTTLLMKYPGLDVKNASRNVGLVWN